MLFNEFKNTWVLFMLVFVSVPKLFVAFLSMNSKKFLSKIRSNEKD